MTTTATKQMTPIATARYFERKLKAQGVDRVTVLTRQAARDWLGHDSKALQAVLISEEAYAVAECCGLIQLVHGCGYEPTPRVPAPEGSAFYEFQTMSSMVFWREA